MVIKCTKLYDPKALWFRLYPALPGFSTKWCYTLTFHLENNMVLPLIMVIKCTKLYDTESYSSIFILPTRFSQTDGLWTLYMK
jgi:hypothetical protein